MQIKKFTAENYAEALSMAKKELGEDALILSARTIGRGKGLREYNGYSKVELTAAADPGAGEAEKSARAVAAPPPASGTAVAEQAPPGKDEEELDLKSLVATLLTQTDRARSMGLRNGQLKLFQTLVDSGVNDRMAAKMFERIDSENGFAGDRSGPDRDKNAAIEMMRRVLLCKGGIELEEKSPKMVALVGPTGAGKTTTIAKLAAHFSLLDRKKVALISLDTYRIGAFEQLRLYGEIMRVPVEMASGAEDFRSIVRKHSDKDLVLVDTTGRSHKDPAYCGRLKGIFDAAGKKVETHIVLSVTSQEKILEGSVKQFSPLTIDRVLFTKLDEGMSFGPMFNFSLKTRIPFSYFTAGQRVPEDIEVADREKVIRLIFN
ncbi:MAG: flagellar biosynthesis protein FlhF [Nitrospinae bacterium]|nr:flagellar biosynthesis protein FlhF [Nitrospinota bacterium]